MEEEISMVCKNCGKEVTAEMSICPNCLVTLVHNTPRKKGIPKAVIVIIILAAVGLAIGIVCGIMYDPIKDIKNGHFKGMSDVTVGEMFDKAVDNANWYDENKDGNTLVCCDGILIGDDVHIVLVEDDGYVYYLSDMMKINGRSVSGSEASTVIATIYTYYKATS